MILALPLMNRANMISHIAVGLMLVSFLYVPYITARYGMKRVDVSHEEACRVLAESSRYIDEERRALARRLHDKVNPQLLPTYNILKQPEPLVAGNGRAAELLGSISRVSNDICAEIRDITENTRIEVIDFIGFTAALESLVAHYTNISKKPAIALEYDLPKRPTMSETSAISAYKIIREAIFNAVKHSKVAQVYVSIHRNRALDTYRMEVADDRVGMKATARNEEHAGIGLTDMCERVRVLGGALKIQAANFANQKQSGAKLSFSFSGQLP